MNTIIIHGRSDDLIEIRGAVGEELYADYGEPTTIRFDNGDTFRVEYDSKGVWRIVPGDLSDDMSKVEVLEPGTVETLCEYSEIAIYQPWNGAESVEKVDQ